MGVATSARRVRRATPDDKRAVTAFLADWGADLVARLGVLEDARRAPKVIARDEGGQLAGVLSYLIAADECGVLTLHAAVPGRGVGTALLEAVEAVAVASGRRRLWLVTTKGDTNALRFYQRRGFRIVRVDPGAVDRARATVKPSIPPVGDHGIPIRDEILLEKRIGEGRG